MKNMVDKSAHPWEWCNLESTGKINQFKNVGVCVGGKGGGWFGEPSAGALCFIR